jgi:hypothetical protein
MQADSYKFTYSESLKKVWIFETKSYKMIRINGGGVLVVRRES